MDAHGWPEAPRTTAVLRTDALDALAADVGAGEAELFARRYLALLEQRLGNLRLAAEAADVTRLREAVLSLQTTSAMVGAEALAGTVGALPPAAGAMATESLAEVEVAAAVTTGALVARASAAVPVGASA
ncbi:hypothetical protein [Georgenia thermotolerans]|uniref:Hpt domain-containing protein n=1 Tax=Georgenia thermotolerans TaxID=527326 RepID=A0A7J5UPD1_9MICO|nr:hypothetical protein [Georgenia thermotolerans]KAE8764177.1 hypothetical protein GB883_10380 [Georgenia thermotolerans]